MSDWWLNRSIVSVGQFNSDHLEEIVRVSYDMKDLVENRGGGDDRLKHKILASIFFEPSTRTQCSFSAAMMRLGGQVLTINESSSSAKKGETLQDTVRCLECYADIAVMRHPEKGSVKLASEYMSVPIINAGDGAGEHPTQALLDYFTIRDETKDLHLDEVVITMVGDLKYGRTVHSLAMLLANSGRKFRLNYISPSALAMPEYVKNEVERKGIKQYESDDLNSVLKESDILYILRIQKERFDSVEEYNKYAGFYIIDNAILKDAKAECRVMHPLPRVGEIKEEVDSDKKRAAYFREMKNGMYVRMALLALLLGKATN